MTKHQKILTHSDYTVRRSRLRADLVAAKLANGKAEFAAALEEISKDDLNETRAAVNNIEAALRGLEVARQESERLEDEQQAVNDSAARLTAAKRARDLAAMRADEMQAVSRIIDSFAPHLKAIAEIDVAIRSTLAPHLRARPEQIRDLVEALNDRTSETEFILVALYAAGFGGWGLGLQFGSPMADLDVLNMIKSNAVEAAARRIAGEDD